MPPGAHSPTPDTDLPRQAAPVPSASVPDRPSEPQAPPDFVVLSPHFDDAVLSCGGSIARAARSGRQVLVVTVCAGAPPASEPVSEFARAILDRWSEAAGKAPIDAERATAIRRAEDEEALAVVGADGIYLDACDAIYRRDADGAWPYADDDSLFGPPAPSDASWVPRLAGRLLRLPGLGPRTVVAAPLGVGGHVDHLVVRRAAEALVAPGKLWYYEDYPYAAQQGSVEDALPVAAGWRRRCIRLGPADLLAKTSAASAYRSQISTFWSGRDEMVAELTAFALARGGGRPSECYWRPVGPDC